MQHPANCAAPTVGHPIRRALIAPSVVVPPQPQTAHEDDNDLKLFALSFTAFFICIYSLIF